MITIISAGGNPEIIEGFAHLYLQNALSAGSNSFQHLRFHRRAVFDSDAFCRPSDAQGDAECQKRASSPCERLSKVERSGALMAQAFPIENRITGSKTMCVDRHGHLASRSDGDNA
ncbi:MAG: hypothetical protein N838_02685 [Thiohalocapsa sp. PB-PSB1]|nr:MAG: hypothetical protein N838_02685 [Thiohalocapsa sp. PB-PSB1]